MTRYETVVEDGTIYVGTEDGALEVGADIQQVAGTVGIAGCR